MSPFCFYKPPNSSKIPNAYHRTWPPIGLSPFSQLFKHLSDNAVEALLEPLDGLLALDAVLEADTALHPAAAGDAVTGAGHAAVEVHAVDTDGGVVLDAEIDVLADTEAEVAGLGEVALAELILLDLEATLDDLLGLFSSCQRLFV